ncbi:MAG: hypothetical protein K6B40_05340 [Firmicutes bacterium]|nr:hypothetical protein [Bacillota bacterium]
MAKMRRFLSRGESWTNGAVILDRGGKEFDEEKDAELIAAILKDGVNAGGMVIEAPSLRQLAQAAKNARPARSKKAQAGSGDPEVDAEVWQRQAGTDLAAQRENGGAEQKKRSGRSKANG